MIEGVKRGSIVIAGDKADLARKPRPMLVAQASKYIGQVDSLTICPIVTMVDTATLFRIRISATDRNGLDHESVICADKITTVRADKVREVIGEASEPIMRSVDEALKRWLSL